MKRIFFLIIVMHCNPVIAEENIAEIPVHGLADATIILNFNLSNIDNSHNVNNARINTNQNLIQDELRSRDIPRSMQDMQSFVSGNIKTYKWHIAGAIALGSYGLLYYYAIKGNNYLDRSDLLSSQELLPVRHPSTSSGRTGAFTPEPAEGSEGATAGQEIHYRYEKDFATSLMLFIKAIEQEEKDLHWYQSFYAWIQYLHISKLLPINKESYEQIAQRLQKLSYYRSCLESLKSTE